MSKEEMALIITILTGAYMKDNKLTEDEKSMLGKIIDKLSKEL